MGKNEDDEGNKLKIFIFKIQIVKYILLRSLKNFLTFDFCASTIKLLGATHDYFTSPDSGK